MPIKLASHLKTSRYDIFYFRMNGDEFWHWHGGRVAAVFEKAIFVTNNIGEYSRVRRLKLEDWLEE